MRLIVINGPSINMLGIREKNIYGETSYDQLVKKIHTWANELEVDVEVYQSNHEGDLIDKIQEAYFQEYDGIIINPGAYTHTSIALLDALKSVKLPAIEVHISDISKREEFRKKSLIKEACLTSIIGQGIEGYHLAMKTLKAKVEVK